PALAQAEVAEERGGRAYAVVVVGPEGVGHRVIRQRVVSRVLVEPRVVPERAQTGQIVRHLPRIAAERVADQVAGENDARHLTPSRGRAGAHRRPRRESTVRRPRARAHTPRRSPRAPPPAPPRPPRGS